MKSFQSIKGFYDVLPEQTALWQTFESTAARILGQYGYRNIRMPLVESTDLFVRSVGEHTDIVEKEMYTWTDALNGDQLTLRPEGTAGCVRAVVEHSLTYNGSQRLWYSGPMFRHENVQKGRQRQFHQIGVEAFGFAGPDVDAEQIVLLHRLWQALGLQGVQLQLNSIGDAEERLSYRQALIHYFEQHAAQLDADAQRRLHSNPMRILDSKNPHMQAMIEQAPRLMDFLGEETKAHFAGLCQRLDVLSIPYQINHRLVRGLDYYNRTVFEFVTDRLGAQGTIAGGGRYDSLVERLGGHATPACGFGIGMERVLLLMQELGIAAQHPVDVYLLHMGEPAQQQAMQLAEYLRDAGLSVILHAEAGSFKSQMKKADRSAASFALILGEDECRQQQVTVKHMGGAIAQVSLAWADAVTLIQQHLRTRS